MMGWIILGIGIVCVVWGITMYNALVRLKGWVTEAWAQIEVQLQRRHDLIPNIVETVKGYAKHESETFESIVKARNELTKAQGQGSPQDIMDASNQLSGVLKTVFALSEAYPDLKSNENFMALQEELSNTENKIAYARQHYNTASANYNIKIASFPMLVFARLFNFTAVDLLAAEQEAKQVPKVQF